MSKQAWALVPEIGEIDELLRRRGLGHISVREVAHDDILDSFAVLWTAERIALGEESTLPDSPPTDGAGLSMEIVF